MAGVDWQAVGSVAGAAGLGLALYTFVTDRLGRRVADIELRFELSQRVDVNGTPRTDSLAVVHNHGPRKASNLRVRLYDGDGNVLDVMRSPTGGELEVLWPNQQFHEPIWRGLGQVLKHADIEWSDGRLRRQRRRYLVSFQRV